MKTVTFDKEIVLKSLIRFVAVALIAAACGGAEVAEAPAETSTTVEQTTTTAAPTTTTTAAPTTTVAATTTTAEAGIVPGEDPEVDAIVLAFQVAFDSESGYDLKAPYIEDPEGLEDTVAKYLETGTAMGGIGVAVTAVTIDGDTAKVSYDLLFGGNPTYPDLSGNAVKTADGWKVPRKMFCSLMSSARVGCPAG